MGDVDPPTDKDWLSELIEKYIGGDSNVPGYSAHSLKVAFLKEIDRIIGEDEVPHSLNDREYSYLDDEIKSHNRLRAEQRYRAGLTPSQQFTHDVMKHSAEIKRSMDEQRGLTGEKQPVQYPKPIKCKTYGTGA